MSKAIQVLVVDDNPAIRALLQEALESMAMVHVFSRADEALRWAEGNPPDLVIADHRMPGSSGQELMAKLRIAFPWLSIMLMASRTDIGGQLAGSAPLVEEFIEKPFFADEAAGRIKRVLDRVALSKAAREESNASAVRGTLAQMSVIDLLQSLDMGRKSCRLVLIQGGRRCEMHFEEGQLLDARLGGLRGEEAVYAVVAWMEGTFLIDFTRQTCPRTIDHSTQSVLLEALRRLDESQREEPLAEVLMPVKPPLPSCAPTLTPAMGF